MLDLGVGQAGPEPKAAVVARPAAELGDLVQVQDRLRPPAVEVERDHHVGPTLDHPGLGVLRPDREGFVEGVRGQDFHGSEGYGSEPMDAHLSKRLEVARGDIPADVVIRGGSVLSVFTREWLETDVAIVDGWVAGLGAYEGHEVVDATGRYVVPGFVDAHMHLESSKLLVDEFARLVLPFGTTAVVADPHEIANVLGTDGVHWLLDATADLPLDVYFMASSCVPASSFESPRRELSPGDLDALLRRRRVIGLAEMMNFPGVIAGSPVELAKLALAQHVDGHAPGVRGRGLQAYAAAGIRSDHEAYTARRGPRTAACRDVAPDPRGLGRAQPAGAPPAPAGVRPRADRVLHRRPRARAHRGRRPHQLDGA